MYHGRLAASNWQHFRSMMRKLLHTSLKDEVTSMMHSMERWVAIRLIEMLASE